jgi:hypothetical protein
LLFAGFHKCWKSAALAVPCSAAFVHAAEPFCCLNIICCLGRPALPVG